MNVRSYHGERGDARLTWESTTMRDLKTGGGWPAIRYAYKMAKRAGGMRKFLKALRSRNTCKTCALGMGGQAGGMVDESGRFPEVCKKSMQAMAADMQPAIPRSFFARNSLEALGSWTSRELEHAGRLATPLMADENDTHLRPVGWDEALTACSRRLAATPPGETFFYASGRSSNEAGFLLQLFARIYGTNNVNNCSYYCHQASGVGLTESIGTGTATIVLEDLRQSDMVFLIGANPASNHPRLMRQLINIRRRGGEVVVINPMVETGLVNFSVPSDVRSLAFGSEVASEYVQPHIGGDAALLTGIAKRIDELDAVDTSFVERFCDDAEDYLTHIRRLEWDTIITASGVTMEEVSRVARKYAKARSVVFAWAMGITHHLHGVENVRAIANLALLRGMIGKPGAGCLPIRGHSNVQGIGSVGVTPALKSAVLERLQSHFKVTLPPERGLDTLACLEAIEAGVIKLGLCLGGNLYGATPDSTRARRTLGKLGQLVYVSTALNTGHIAGRAKQTIILPALARDEEPQSTTQESMFSFVRLSDGGSPRHDGPRSEVEILARLARGVLGDSGPIDWRSMQRHRTIRRAIGAIVPGYEAIAAIDETKQEFQISGRTFHRPKFPTANGKARFHVAPLPMSAAKPGEFLMMTIRSEGQFNTVVYEEHDLYRSQARRDVILMNAADISGAGLMEGDCVTVQSKCGEMSKIIVRAFAIREGNVAMYYPEANVLVPFDADPKSKTPAFKAVAVSVRPD